MNKLSHILLGLLVWLASTAGMPFPAIADPAQADAPGSQENLKSLFDDGQIDALAKQNQQHNGQIVSDIGKDAVQKIKEALPQLGQEASRLRYGYHNVVSDNGEQVILLILSLAKEPKKQNDTLRELQNLSRQGNPEAMNFVGFVLAHGLFGTKKNLDAAENYFRKASLANYQPALYNMAILSSYGHRRRQEALDYIVRAANVAEDISWRVCGFASFLFYRASDEGRAQHYAGGCLSGLANLAAAMANPPPELAKRIQMLRLSIATGLDDGYVLLEQVALDNIEGDNEFSYCKYALLNRYRQNNKLHLQELAAECYDQEIKRHRQIHAASLRETSIRGIAAFPISEAASLKGLRESNHFHYSWTVPFLPFDQQDVNLLAPIFKTAKAD